MANPDPKRVLLTGDVHGNTEWAVRHVLKTARRKKAQLILQVGDMGVWPGTRGKRFLDQVDHESGLARIPWHFIDGNHEDFDQLLAYPVGDDGRRIVRQHIFHLPRGFRWSWAGRSFVALGGAGSIDRDSRLPGHSWWPQETITDDDVRECIRGGSVDVLIAHDAPVNLHIKSDWGKPPEDILLDLEASRGRLQQVVDACQPKLVVHGHWHFGQRSQVQRANGGSYEVVSLAADGQVGGHCALLDLVALRFSPDPSSAVSVID